MIAPPDLGGIARRSAELGARGVPVAVYTAAGGQGGNPDGLLTSFRALPGVDTYVARGWGAARQLSVVVTDFGIENWNRELRMFGDFKHAASASVIPGLPKEGQILIPMPEALPRTEAGRHTLELDIARGIIKRIETGGLAQYEVRLVQNINTLGYFDQLSRQREVKEFGLIAYGALAHVKQHFSAKGTVIDMPAIAGSNGAYMLTETLPRLSSNPVDRAALVDARAYVNPTRETYKVLHGNLIGINTSGDAPAMPGIPAFPNLVANHDVMKGLKRDLSDMKVFWVDPKGPDLFISHHLASMKPGAELLVKEFDGQGYTTPSKTTGWGLMSGVLGLTAPPAAGMGVGAAREWAGVRAGSPHQPTGGLSDIGKQYLGATPHHAGALSMAPRGGSCSAPSGWPAPETAGPSSGPGIRKRPSWSCRTRCSGLRPPGSQPRDSAASRPARALPPRDAKQSAEENALVDSPWRGAEVMGVMQKPIHEGRERSVVACAVEREGHQ